MLNNNLKTQSGRSMIEMLGVLAIIGVLSVGGIAGYSKAMMQYKINKTSDQITHIVGNIRTLFGSQRNYYNVSNYDVLRKGHIIPEEMWNGSDVENAFGGHVWIDSAGKRSDDGKAFQVNLYGLPEEACMALATYDWGSGSSSGLLGISVHSGSMGSYGCSSSQYSGAVACAMNTGSSSSSIGIPMPVNVAASACHEGDSNAIYLRFY